MIKLPSPEGIVPLREKRWPELDGLRGTAILLVFLIHYVTNSRTHEGNFGPLYRFAQLFRLGWSGVDLFFVLSGFLIGGILLDARSSSNYFRMFYTRRVYRILPIYYVWIALYSIAGYSILKWGAPEHVATAGEALHPVLFLFFLQNILLPKMIFSQPFPFSFYAMGPTWSLAVEEQFYLVAPFFIRYLSLRRLTLLLLGCVLGAPFLRYFVFSGLPNGPAKSYILMPCRADALAMGMLAAIAWRTSAKDWLLRHKRLLKAMAVVLFAGVLLMIKWLPQPGTSGESALQYSWIALMYSLFLLIALLDSRSLVARTARWRFLRECGRVSYCFYLIHSGILAACHWVFFRSEPHIDDWPGVGVTLLAALLAWTAAQLSWKYFEKPLLDRGHALSYNP